MRGAPVPPEEYADDGEHALTDEVLAAQGWAYGLDAWEQIGKAYGNYLGDGQLANAQMWSLQEAIKANPRRDDPVAAWLKRKRDEMGSPTDDAWRVIDDLLDEYREHADTGTPLDREVAGPNEESA